MMRDEPVDLDFAVVDLEPSARLRAFLPDPSRPPMDAAGGRAAPEHAGGHPADPGNNGADAGSARGAGRPQRARRPSRRRPGAGQGRAVDGFVASHGPDAGGLRAEPQDQRGPRHQYQPSVNPVLVAAFADLARRVAEGTLDPASETYWTEVMRISMNHAGEFLAVQSPGEYVKQLSTASLTLQKVRGGAKREEKNAAARDLETLRDLLEPDEA